MTKKRLTAEVVPLSSLEDDPNNANAGTEEGAAIITRSMDKFGFVAPGLVNKLPSGEKRVIAGNKRKAAATALGHDDALLIPWDGKKPIYLETSLPDEEATELAYLLNLAPKVNIKWSRSQLQADAKAGLDLSSYGFSPQELVRLGVNPKPTDETGISDDDVDSANSEASTLGLTPTRGDIWQLSSSPPTYVICANCRDISALDGSIPLLHESSISGIVTSPPYAMQRSAHYGGIAEADYTDWFLKVSAALSHFLSPNGSFFLNIKPHSTDFQRSLYVFDLVLALTRQAPWLFVDEFCWQHGGIPGSPHSMGRFKNQFEPIYHFALSTNFTFFPENVVVPTDSAVLDEKWEPALAQNSQGRETTFANRSIGPGLAYPGNVLSLKQKELTGHEATFPPSLPRFFMRAFSPPDGVWLDPFLGSGTTCMAAHALGLPSVGIEIQPRYVGQFLERFYAFTDNKEIPVKIGELND